MLQWFLLFLLGMALLADVLPSGALAAQSLLTWASICPKGAGHETATVQGFHLSQRSRT